MNDNNKEATRTRLKRILVDLQRLESLHELIRSNEYTGFMEMSRPQQEDILDTASDMSLDVRCRLAKEIERLPSHSATIRN